MSVAAMHGDCREILPTLGAESVNCCVTSPPYWGLRDYGCEGQIGLEPTPEAYVAKLVAVFREVRRVLRAEGTVWLNLGDSYCTVPHGPKEKNAPQSFGGGGSEGRGQERKGSATVGGGHANRKALPGLKHKDLVGIPWRVAFALQADGWYLRSDIIWAKPNPMPESVTDRPTKAHEYVFLLSKSARYWYDAGAISEEFAGEPYEGRANGAIKNGDRADRGRTIGMTTDRRNARTVWTIATQPFSGAHFATMPPALAERCILAGCPEGGTVLDPFGGAGTTGLVADRLGRNAVLIELNGEYRKMAAGRIQSDAPLFAEVSE